MECKSTITGLALALGFRINRYIMECKCYCIDMRGRIPIAELIDTLWNVNRYRHRYTRQRQYELIDTLWNVNKADCWCFGFPCQGINRYIMECKLLHSCDYISLFSRINRYIMECK